jgi:hypothetical protein
MSVHLLLFRPSILSVLLPLVHLCPLCLSFSPLSRLLSVLSSCLTSVSLSCPSLSSMFVSLSSFSFPLALRQFPFLSFPLVIRQFPSLPTFLSYLSFPLVSLRFPSLSSFLYLQSLSSLFFLLVRLYRPGAAQALPAGYEQSFPLEVPDLLVYADMWNKLCNSPLHQKEYDVMRYTDLYDAIKSLPTGRNTAT